MDIGYHKLSIPTGYYNNFEIAILNNRREGWDVSEFRIFFVGMFDKIAPFRRFVSYSVYFFDFVARMRDGSGHEINSTNMLHLLHVLNVKAGAGF